MIHAVLLLDESGSMQNVREDVVGGVNGYIETLKKDKEGDVSVTIYTFDLSGRPIVREMVPEGTALKNVPVVTLDDYLPHGSTPLNYAVITAIERVKKFAKKKDDVLFIVYTDGQENASNASAKTVKSAIAKREEKGWEFIYLGANQDAWDAGSAIGVSGLKLNTSGTKIGTQAMFFSAANMTNTARSSVGDGGVLRSVRESYGHVQDIGETPVDENDAS